MPDNKNSLHYLRHAARAYRLQMGVNIVLGVTDVLIGLLEVWLTKQLIDSATSGRSWAFADGGWLSLPALAAMLLACMLLSVALVWIFAFTRFKVERWEGFVLLAGYLAYLIWLIISL
jgi:Ca2+/Na+ antiporter